MQPDDGAYIRDEVRASDGSFPTRGLICERCKIRIPQFQDLSSADETRIRALIGQRRSATAMEELVAATGCPMRWAKIWVTHSGRPHARLDGPPCPYCGKALATSRAKQCLSCGADWHREPPVAGRDDG
jgi:hypothetical protein